MNEEIEKVISVLEQGGIILYPTDTIWGLGCDACNAEAVKKIYDLKQREDNKKMLVLVDSIAKVNGYVKDLPDVAWDLVELAEKPLTIIYQNGRYIANNLLGENDSIGIRVTKEKFSKTLCERFKRPIVSTSANIHGEETPACFSQIDKKIINGVDYVVKYRQNEKIKSKPSSIVMLSQDSEVKILRE